MLVDLYGAPSAMTGPVGVCPADDSTVVLSALVNMGVIGEDEGICLPAPTLGDPVERHACGTQTGRVHWLHERVVAGVPVDERQVVVSARIRRLACPTIDRLRLTFREQDSCVVER
ncbi:MULTISPECIES: hypothetical protein [unclassified Streptomyces]|uniref:hypothetical protein n=1 Tax=unclassified Streptomyces TaxID=2593676 RepID=UPI00403CB4C9